MSSRTFQSTFDMWLDEALTEPVPASVVAFSFNLAEPWSIEIAGCDFYSEDDSDWACEESFRPKRNSLPLPRVELGTKWEDVLESVKRIVADYLDRPSEGSAILRQVDAIVVGFVDGDLHKVWPK